MVGCSALGCNNRTQKGGSISFFTFPKNAHLRKAWVHYCKRWDFVPQPGNRLCSAHFSPNCFERDVSRFTDLGLEGNFRPRLKSDATPDVPLSSAPANSKDGDVKLTAPRRGAFEKRRKAEVILITIRMFRKKFSFR